MKKLNFFQSESGAVTVDWVVLTAAIVGLGLVVIDVVSGGINKSDPGLRTPTEQTGD